MKDKQPNLFGDMDDDVSMEAIIRKEGALGDRIDWQRGDRSRGDIPWANHLDAIRSKHMAPGDYDDLDACDPDGFDEFDGGF